MFSDMSDVDIYHCEHLVQFSVADEPKIAMPFTSRFAVFFNVSRFACENLAYQLEIDNANIFSSFALCLNQKRPSLSLK